MFRLLSLCLPLYLVLSASFKHVVSVPSEVNTEREDLYNASKDIVSINETNAKSFSIQDLWKAKELLQAAADLGHPEAQFEVGVQLLSGVGGEKEPAQGLLQLYFAAQGGSLRAQMSLGHRHMFGLGVPRSCQAAVLYYAKPAQEVVTGAKHKGGHPAHPPEKVRLSLDHSTQYNPGREADVLQYYQYSADMGNVDAQTAIGQLLHTGARGMERDYHQAARYFMQAAAVGDTDAMSHLGHMYANGLGVEPDNETAVEYFRKGAEKGQAHALYGLGYMYLAGAGVPLNVKKATSLFVKAADKGSADAHFHLGVLAVNGVGMMVDYNRAFQHFNAASHSGHLLAVYNLALMQLGGLGVPPSCPSALALLKSVAERGNQAKVLEEAHAQWVGGEVERALLGYLQGAELGFEVAQANAAFLHEVHPELSELSLPPPPTSDDTPHPVLDENEEQPSTSTSTSTSTSPTPTTSSSTASSSAPEGMAWSLYFHQRAADQGNVNSLLKIGDAYFYGRGARIDLNKSVAVYRQATQYRSAQAMFNLGYLHEHGLGLPQDLHLAKRYYDMAKSAHPDAFAPVALALVKLGIHSWYNKNRVSIQNALRILVENSDDFLIAFLCALLGTLVLLRRVRQANNA